VECVRNDQRTVSTLTPSLRRILRLYTSLSRRNHMRRSPNLTEMSDWTSGGYLT
jgi:hypothetical protein